LNEALFRTFSENRPAERLLKQVDNFVEIAEIDASTLRLTPA